MKIRTFSGCVLCCLLLAGQAGAQPIFTGMRWGNPPNEPSAIGDYDNDGWPDVFRSGRNNGTARVALMHNEAGNHFTDQTDHIRTEMTANRKGGGPLFGDYDNDGDLDLFIPVGSFWSEERGRNVLLRNDRGFFIDVALAAGLADELPTDNAIWLDFDRDGYLDIYTGNVGCCPDDPTVRNKLYRNNGDGTFADVTANAGLDLPLSPQSGGSNGSMAAGDFNGDGWPDLYVGVFRAPNRLFLNDGQGHFRDGTTKEIADPGQAFDVAVGDIDNDLDLDIFQAAGGIGLTDRSLMLLNLGQGQFLDVTEGVGTVLIGNVEDVGFGDIDNDGDLDLSNGVPGTVFFNNGEGFFVEQTSQAVGEVDLYPPVVFWDYNLDGALDGQGWTAFFRNKGNDNHYLRVELVGIKSNRNGIGARLFATSGDLKQMREVLGGRGFNQDELVAHFGLGQRTKVDRLEIRWPSGQVEVLTDIPADQKIRVIEGSGRYYRVEPSRWQQAPPETLVAGTDLRLALAIQPALFEPGASITQVTTDLSAFGGPEAVSLQADSDGTYSLEPLSLTIPGPNGFRTLSVMIDQTTSLGPHWTQLSKSILVLPAGDLPLLAEGLAPGWTAEADDMVARLDLEQGAQVHTGKKAVALSPAASSKKAWELVLGGPVLGAVEGFTALGLAIHLGETPQPADAALKILVNAGAPFDLTSRLDLGRRGWQELQVPLAELGVRQPLTRLVLRGTLAGTIYLDDIRLVAATPSPGTVVEEDRTATLPQSFSLSQNFPNPFNSSTVIRFELPESGEVELAVFDLAGQRVVELVEGVREAGSYTLLWDGRDGRGKELASGIYLYRLRAGERMETRKLVLVR